MSQDIHWPSQSVTATNPSVGITGTPAPTSATEIAGVTTAGTLVPVHVTTDGAVFTTPEAGSLTNVNITEYGSVATSLGQKTSAASMPVVLASDETVPISAVALPLPAGASTSSNQVTQIGQLTTISSNTGTILAQQTNGTQTTSISGAGGTPTATVTAASTAATAANPGLVVSLSPNSPLPAGTNALGSVSITGTTPISGTVTANQGTAGATPWPVNIADYGGTATTLGQKVSASSMPVVLASDETVPISAVSLPLPAGAATASNQGTIISELTTISSNTGTILAQQTNGTQKATVFQGTPAALTVTQAAKAVGLTAVRLTVSGAAPAASRVVLVGSPAPGTATTVNFYIGSSTVTSTGATRGPSIQFGQSFIANNDAGDYWICSDTAGQTVDVMEQE